MRTVCMTQIQVHVNTSLKFLQNQGDTLFLEQTVKHKYHSSFLHYG